MTFKPTLTPWPENPQKLDAGGDSEQQTAPPELRIRATPATSTADLLVGGDQDKLFLGSTATHDSPIAPAITDYALDEMGRVVFALDLSDDDDVDDEPEMPAGPRLTPRRAILELLEENPDGFTLGEISALLGLHHGYVLKISRRLVLRQQLCSRKVPGRVASDPIITKFYFVSYSPAPAKMKRRRKRL